MPPTQTNRRSNQIRHLKLSDIQSRTNSSESMLQDGTTPLHWARGWLYAATADMLLNAGAHAKAKTKVRPNMSVAIISIVYSLALSMTFQYTRVSTL